MTSTLPNLSAKPTAAAEGLNAVLPADLGAPVASPGNPPGDFVDLMPVPCEATVAQTAVLATTSASSIQSFCVSDTEAVAATDIVPGVPGDARPEVSRDIREQAAAFAAGLLQALLPEVQLPEMGAEALPVATDVPASAGSNANAGAAFDTDALAVPTTAGAPGSRDAGLPVQTELDETRLPATSGLADSASSTAQTSFAIAYAEDGAVGIKLDLPNAAPATESGTPAATPVQVRAELELPGQAVVRLEANGTFSPADGAGPGRANFAAKKDRSGKKAESSDGASERNFVFTADKRVKTGTSEDGIAVAKMEATMSTATLPETRPLSVQANPFGLPARGEFSVAWPAAPAQAATARVSVENNFAERAVATVTGLVDAQFTASMQKSGSVHLQLKFGGDDLSVRVELRGGFVHTNFRTDSAELRAALTREMQAVTNASPDETRRYLDPVFSPGASASPFSGQSQSQSGRQQQQAQQDLSDRAPRSPFEEAAPFARRSLLRDTFFPEPVAPRAPTLLPTSLRLSALA